MLQSIVEKPYPYLLAQSGTSVKDQLLYTPARWEDLEELSVPSTLEDHDFHDAAARMWSTMWRYAGIQISCLIKMIDSDRIIYFPLHHKIFFTIALYIVLNRFSTTY